MLLILGGLSGAGKSTLGRYLEKQCAFRWIELDPPGENEVNEVNDVTELKISSQWKEFRAGNPSPLIQRFPGNTVITFASFVITDASKYLTSSEIRIRYLLGPKEACFCRANARSPEIVSQQHWDKNNNSLLAYFDSGNCPAEWKIEVFHNSGRPRSLDELARAII